MVWHNCKTDPPKLFGYYILIWGDRPSRPQWDKAYWDKEIWKTHEGTVPEHWCRKWAQIDLLEMGEYLDD